MRGDAERLSNGGHYFYGFGPIAIDGEHAADVDHFFPHALGRHLLGPTDSIWNLVLACNRGAGGKSDMVPARDLVARLHLRNEFYIDSNHKLATTLIAQTGGTERSRRAFLQHNFEAAKLARVHEWIPMTCGEEAF